MEPLWVCFCGRCASSSSSLFYSRLFVWSFVLRGFFFFSVSSSLFFHSSPLPSYSRSLKMRLFNATTFGFNLQDKLNYVKSWIDFQYIYHVICMIGNCSIRIWAYTQRFTAAKLIYIHLSGTLWVCTVRTPHSFRIRRNALRSRDTRSFRMTHKIQREIIRT